MLKWIVKTGHVKNSCHEWGTTALILRRFLSPPDKLAFVGFKGSFRPDWVRMSVDEERAKLHQVLPIPVIKMMKLWKSGTQQDISDSQ